MRRVINISTQSYVSMSDSMLQIESRPSGASYRVPIREIDTVVIEHPATVVSSRLLAELADSGATVIFCGIDHMPIGIEIPLNSNTSAPVISNLQLTASKPLIKQLWKAIVRAKILNQASVLRFLGRDDSQLLEIASKVASDDSTNRESVAAVAYFSKLIPRGGRWNSSRTSPLNYGYSIERAGIARAVCAAGLIPSKGIHHHSSMNPLNLVDDLIEPFRPVVDAIVLHDEISSPLSRSEKLELLRVHETLVLIDGRRVSCQTAYSESVNSFVDSLGRSDAKLLKTPSFIGLERIDVS